MMRAISDKMTIAWQVIKAAERVSHLRTTVPAVLSEKFKGMLEGCRPVTSTAETHADEIGGARPEAEDAALSPAPTELQGKFTAVTTGIPSLRYRTRVFVSVRFPARLCSCQIHFRSSVSMQGLPADLFLFLLCYAVCCL